MEKQIRQFWRSAKQIIKTRFFYIAGVVSFLFFVFSLFLIWWRLFPEITDQVAIPLHYNTHFGVDLFGSWWQIFLVPALQLGFMIINVVIAIILWKKDKVLARIVLASSAATSIILFIAMIFIVLLNLTYYG